ncbi:MULTISPECIES: hypothetical protein [unclassified Oscillibacter]|uniref:hypothetical protein n=1 Tax=unclassified Oscillibacter TaxID=2629304 RepID=UPI0025EF046D|nr:MULTISPECIES: hypothetical protein [unclassified Oscillibacter]
MREKRLIFWLLGLALALCAALAGLVLLQGSRLRALRENAPAAISSPQDGAPISTTPENSAHLIKAFELTPAGTDEAKGTATAEITLRLWEDQTDAAVKLLIDVGEKTVSVPLVRSANRTYTAPVTLALPDKQSGEDTSVSLTVEVEEGGVLSRERLWEYPNSLFMTTTLRADLKEGGMSYVRKSLPTPGVGLMRFNPECRLTVMDGDESLAIKDPAFRLYCNGELIKSLPAVEDETGRNLYGPQLWDNALVCRNGDRIRLSFSCTGEDGRFYEFPLETARIAHEQGEVTSRLMPPAVS